MLETKKAPESSLCMHYLASLAERRALSRLALFLWIKPFVSALSIAELAARKSSSDGFASNALIAVRIADF